MHNKVNNHDNGRKLVIFNFIELKFFCAYPLLKLHILFYFNGLAIWHGLQGITYIKNK